METLLIKHMEVQYDEKNDKKVDGIGPIKLIENHLEFAIKDLAVKIKNIFIKITKNFFYIIYFSFNTYCIYRTIHKF